MSGCGTRIVLRGQKPLEMCIRDSAYRVKGAGREQETWHNLHVIYTREAETADMFIERATHEPVSYTHLDVYKRQPQTPSLLLCDDSDADDANDAVLRISLYHIPDRCV